VGDPAGFTVGDAIVIGTGASRETLRYITSIAGFTINFADIPGPPLFDQSTVFAHAVGTPVAQVMFSQSQRDFDADGFVTVIGDIALMAAAFGTMGGSGTAAFPGYQGRLDLNYDDFIDVTGDIAFEAGVAFLAC
jgi:hypothetical protein